MPGQVPPVADEREGLLAYLAQQRDAIRIAALRLDRTTRRGSPPTAGGALSVGGLIKHVATVEQGWIDIVLQRPGGRRTSAASDYEANFRLGPNETLADVFSFYDDVAKETEAAIAGIADLSRPVPVPQGVPWFPDDVDAWSVRWVLLHLIEETARHAGHADIVRVNRRTATVLPTHGGGRRLAVDAVDAAVGTACELTAS